ncbi:MAG: ABC transporter substrate-binding protein [Deltaproteobacteria bacterium]
MKTIPFIFSLGFIFNLLHSIPTYGEESGSAKDVTARLEQLFEASKKVNLEGDEKQKAIEVIENAMDWDKIAQVCLGAKQAKKNSGKNFEEFRNLLKDVITRTAFTRLDKFWQGSAKYKFEKIEVTGNNAKVPTKFFVKGEPFELEYYFSKKGSEWLIYDISYEEVRYSTNISQQIESFLREGDFTTLLSKLKKRRDDLIEATSKSKKT